MRLALPLRLALAAAVLAAAALGGPGISPALARPRPARAAAPTVPVVVDGSQPGRAIEPGYLGLSFEAAALGQIVRLGQHGDLVGLLRSVGPGLMRFGGITADENVGWTDAQTPPPPWATSVIDPAELDALGTLARRTGWHVLLTVGLAHYEPLPAAREVAAAHRALGPYLAAVEIGNEPDSLGRHGYRALPWLAQGYEEEVASYREAIAALTPGVAIAGPDVSGSGLFAGWGEAEALAQVPALLTGHHYPLGCAQTPPPSIEALLSVATRHREAGSLSAYLKVSRTSGIPLRIDETNSVSCGGVPGISDTFASALWATAYTTQVIAAGAQGLNLQGNPTNCPGYTPLCAPTPAALAAGALSARPDWYALLITRSLAGSRPLLGRIETSPAPNLVAQPFVAPDGDIQTVLVDDEPPQAGPLVLRLHVGAGYRTATVLRLTAPSPSATADVELGGHVVARDGSLPAPRAIERHAVHGGVVKIVLPPSSAALVSTGPPRRHARAR
ncbi:MAG TPA: glycosyl hydrolase family 79 C-terminal domain-containing protein [Solirubrobacteraceae bacterium]|jgi:hypothetical protein|nr:glycosyl hydrolase family 79 C-terminal domain-containing protein [Solirubrobacteraceae bacterium]